MDAYQPADPVTGFSKAADLSDVPRFPAPSDDTGTVAHRQTERAEQRMREGRTGESVWSQTAEAKRRGLLKAFGRS
jgi:hypothetical protein